MTAFINQIILKVKFHSHAYPGKIIPIDLTQFGKSFVRILSRPKVFLLESNSLKTRNWVRWGRFHHAKKNDNLITPEER
jgi:hypothetical protein